MADFLINVNNKMTNNIHPQLLQFRQNQYWHCPFCSNILKNCGYYYECKACPARTTIYSTSYTPDGYMSRLEFLINDFIVVLCYTKNKLTVHKINNSTPNPWNIIIPESFPLSQDWWLSKIKLWLTFSND